MPKAGNFFNLLRTFSDIPSIEVHGTALNGRSRTALYFIFLIFFFGSIAKVVAFYDTDCIA